MKAPSSIGVAGLLFQRLSTESAVKLTTQPLASRWLWYWQDQVKNWKQYGQVRALSEDKNSSSTMYIKQNLVNAFPP